MIFSPWICQKHRHYEIHYEISSHTCQHANIYSSSATPMPWPVSRWITRTLGVRWESPWSLNHTLCTHLFTHRSSVMEPHHLLGLKLPTDQQVTCMFLGAERKLEVGGNHEENI